MRIWVLGLLIWVVAPIGVTAKDLGIVSTADYLRLPVMAVDSAGIEQVPDSGHILVWFEGEGTVNSASYTNRWTNAGAGGSYVDSVRYANHTYYYFVDQVADIDNDEGNGIYTGVVILYTDGQPWPNDFTFTLADDELADYWAEVTRQGDSIDAYHGWVAQQSSVDNVEDSLFAIIDTLQNQDNWGSRIPDLWPAADSVAYQGSAAGLDSTTVARAVWNTPAANHSGDGTFGRYLDTTVSSVTMGSGAYATTLVAYDTSKAQTVSGVRLAVRNLAQTSLLALITTGSAGAATVNLDADDYLVSATAPGYHFGAFDTISVSGALTDSVLGYQFDPGSPESPSLCRVYGYLFTTEGEAEVGARITAYLPGGVSRYSGLIISPFPTTTTTNDNGFFYLDLIPSSSLTGTPLYEFTISRTDGTILRKRLSVPDSSNWQITW